MSMKTFYSQTHEMKLLYYEKAYTYILTCKTLSQCYKYRCCTFDGKDQNEYIQATLFFYSFWIPISYMRWKCRWKFPYTSHEMKPRWKYLDENPLCLHEMKCRWKYLDENSLNEMKNSIHEMKYGDENVNEIWRWKCRWKM